MSLLNNSKVEKLLDSVSVSVCIHAFVCACLYVCVYSQRLLDIFNFKILCIHYLIVDKIEWLTIYKYPGLKLCILAFFNYWYPTNNCGAHNMGHYCKIHVVWALFLHFFACLFFTDKLQMTSLQKCIRKHKQTPKSRYISLTLWRQVSSEVKE